MVRPHAHPQALANLEARAVASFVAALGLAEDSSNA